MELPDFDSGKTPFPGSGDSLPSLWDKAHTLVIDAETKGILDTAVKPLGLLSKSGSGIEAMPYPAALNPVRFKAAAEQLWLLGYLDQKPGPGETGSIQTSPGFKRGLENFQEEAGLTRDGWMGKETWAALNALVGFESRTDLKRWKRKGLYCSAFLRAVQLRLWVYGMTDEKPGPGFDAVDSGGVGRFKKVLWSLSAIKGYQGKMADKKFFKLLFDSRYLVRKAAAFIPQKKSGMGTMDTFYDRELFQSKHKGVKEAKRRFLVNLAKVELWLLGSEIKIDGKDDFPVRGLGSPGEKGKRLFPDTHGKVGEHILGYWRKLTVFGEMEARKKAKAITPSLFKSFILPRRRSFRGTEQFSGSDLGREIQARFEAAPDPQVLIARAYGVGKDLGMGLWDGLERVGAWMQKGEKKILSFGKNMLRGFYRLAMGSHAIIRTAFTVFARSMDQYMAGRLDLSPCKGVWVFLEKEMDNLVVVHSSARSSDILLAKRAMDRFSAMFLFSCKLIGVFVDALKSMALGLTGWARLLMALVQIHRELIPAYRQLSAVL